MMIRASLLSLVLSSAALAGVLEKNSVDPTQLTSGAAAVVDQGLGAAPTGGLSSRPLTGLPTPIRVELVKAALAAVRAFVSSKQGVREIATRSLGGPPRDPAEELEAARAGMSVEQALTGVPKEDQPAVRKQLEQAKQELDARFAEARRALPAARAQWKEELARWEARRTEEEAKVPEKVRAVLVEFLNETTNMPWGAKLSGEGDWMQFDDPKIEAMPRWWKACFRAGKESVEVARGLADKWLKSLPKK